MFNGDFKILLLVVVEVTRLSFPLEIQSLVTSTATKGIVALAGKRLGRSVAPAYIENLGWTQLYSIQLLVIARFAEGASVRSFGEKGT
jgi:hypothetical protein